MWLFFALGSVLATTTLAILFRVLSVKASDSRAFAFAFNTTVLCYALILCLVFGVGSINFSRELLFLLMLSGLGYGVFQRYQFVVRKHLPASEVQIVYAPTGIAGYILAIFWLGESADLVRIAGYGLVLLAAFLVIKRPKKFVFNHFVLLAFLTGAALSIAATIDRKIAPEFSSVLLYVAILWFFQALFCFVPKLSFASIKTEFLKQYKLIIPLAAINLIALFCLISALRLAPATQVMPVANSNLVFISLAAIIFLKERERIPVKIAAALIATLGLFLVSR